MMTTRVVSLSRLMKSPTLAGITARSAWGSTMKMFVCAVERPRALAASFWPLGMACRPPRTFSATYAAEKRVIPPIARRTRSMRTSPGRKSGSMMSAMNRIVMSGTPRITSM
jgi:hypothetical protein